MRPYPKYKPSGIEWIGEIPEKWNVKKLKYVALVQLHTPPKLTSQRRFTLTTSRRCA